MAQHLVIVSYRRGEAERNGVEAGGLRSQVEARRIGTANDHSELRQSRTIEVVLLEEGIEAAQIADVSQLNTGEIVRNGPGLRRDGKYLVGRNIVKLCLRIDKPQNQPRTGDAIDFGTFARNPFHKHLLTVGTSDRELGLILNLCNLHYNNVESTT
jgi:hypothetical protein